MSRLLRAALLMAFITAALSSCTYRGAESLPLPSGLSHTDTYSITVTLPSATNLVPQETCRANDAVVGMVASVTLDARLQARVICRIKTSVHLPANVRASLQQTSLLGERFVALDPPAGTEPSGILAAGAHIPETSTQTDPDVETVLGALSQVLNGGSLGSLQTITTELGTALHESNLRNAVDQLQATIGLLNSHRDDIEHALDGLDRLAGALARQRHQIAAALDQVPDGIAALDRQRPQLVRALQALRQLSTVARPLIAHTREATTADLANMEPVLTQVQTASNELALALERVVTFPFPSTATSIMRGDYAGFNGTVRLDATTISSLLATLKNVGGGQIAGINPNGAPTPDSSTATSTSGGAALGALPGGSHDLLHGLLQGLEPLFRSAP